MQACTSEMKVWEEEIMKLTVIRLIVIREAVMKERMGTDNSRERLNVQDEAIGPRTEP